MYIASTDSVNINVYFLHRKRLFNNAKETKEVWSDEEDVFGFAEKKSNDPSTFT